MDAATFRTDFPEFADTTKYPDARVNFWLGIAGKMINVDRWQDLADQGTELFMAHNLTLSAQDMAAVSSGGVSGGAGLVNSQSVDKVSVAFDSASVIEDGAGNYNLTSYGRQYIRLARLMGAGGIQL